MIYVFARHSERYEIRPATRQLLLFLIAGWINRDQQDVVEYLRTENQILKEKLGKKRILLDDDQRRGLAVKGRILGRKALQEIATIVTPDTILRWHHDLVARKWDYNERRQKLGRPPVSKETIEILRRMAREYPCLPEKPQGRLILGRSFSVVVGPRLRVSPRVLRHKACPCRIFRPSTNSGYSGDLENYHRELMSSFPHRVEPAPRSLKFTHSSRVMTRQIDH